MCSKFVYNGSEDWNFFFSEIGLQTAETLMLKDVNT